MSGLQGLGIPAVLQGWGETNAGKSPPDAQVFPGQAEGVGRGSRGSWNHLPAPVLPKMLGIAGDRVSKANYAQIGRKQKPSAGIQKERWASV